MGFEMLEGRTMMSATYYVATNGSDSNAGTITSPWKTLQKAVASVASGDTVNLRGGTYAGGVTLNKSNVTVQSYTGEKAYISSSYSDANVPMAFDLGTEASGTTL